jgi:transposase InsO family protein
MYDEIKRRLTWIRLYQETSDAGLVCRRCGISYPTLRKWLRRYEELGEDGLASQSRRPRHSPTQKVFEEEEGWILALRRERKLGARRIQHELRREHQCFLSLETIHKVLTRHPTPPVRRPKRLVVPKRYSMGVPGERAQMDTMKLAPGLYQYTFVDDCTRYLVAALYPRRTAANTVDFLEQVLEEIPFPIQRLQTDNGTEFMAYKVRDFLLDLCIKHRPIPPWTPHLNGKVERAQKTTLDEFYATTTLASPSLQEDLGEWLTDYNYRRVHGSLGMTPMQRFSEKAEAILLWEEIAATFDRAQEANYVDLLWLKRHRQQASKK